MEMDDGKIRRALVSVSDKSGVVELCKTLVEAYGVEIVSTGGTRRALEEGGVPVVSVESITGFPEVFGGRVKTLHPLIHGGLLMRRSVASDAEEAEKHGIAAIDLVVCNLYPFEDVVGSAVARGDDVDDVMLTDHIDIGGVTMIRAAAKGYCEGVSVLADPDQYPEFIATLAANAGAVPPPVRKDLAIVAFSRTRDYDTAIAQHIAP